MVAVFLRPGGRPRRRGLPSLFCGSVSSYSSSMILARLLMRADLFPSRPWFIWGGGLRLRELAEMGAR